MFYSIFLTENVNTGISMVKKEKEKKKEINSYLDNNDLDIPCNKLLERKNIDG